MDHSALNKMSFVENMCTCPAMQLSLVVLGGPQVKTKHRNEVMFFTVLVFAFGFAAALLSALALKLLCYIVGCGFFMALVEVSMARSRS